MDTDSEVVVTAEVAELVHLVFKAWPLLQLALQNEWGGPESAEKAEWFEGIVGQQLSKAKKIEVFDLEDIMEDIIANEFAAIAEDGSVVQVARLLVRVRDELQAGDTRGISELRAKHSKANDDLSNALKSSASGANADDDSDSEDGEGEWLDAEDEGSAASSSAAEPPSRKPEPDADGWTTIPTRRKR